MKLLVDPMLMSGRWTIIIFSLLVAAPSYAAGIAQVPQNKDKYNETEDLAHDQLKAFELSSRSRTMPSASWFVNRVYIDSEGVKPAQAKFSPASLARPE